MTCNSHKLGLQMVSKVGSNHHISPQISGLQPHHLHHGQQFHSTSHSSSAPPPLQPPCAWAKMDGCQSTLRHQSPSKIKSNTPPEINTRPLKRDYFNRKYIFQPSIFRGHSLVFWGVNVTPGAYSTGNFRNSSPSGLILSLLAPFPPRPSISFWSWTSCFWILADRMTTYRAQLNNLKIIPFQKEKHLSNT